MISFVSHMRNHLCQNRNFLVLGLGSDGHQPFIVNKIPLKGIVTMYTCWREDDKKHKPSNSQQTLLGKAEPSGLALHFRRWVVMIPKDLPGDDSMHLTFRLCRPMICGCLERMASAFPAVALRFDLLPLLHSWGT